MRYFGWCDGSFKNGVGIAGFIIRDEENNLIDGGYEEYTDCKDSSDAEHHSIILLLSKLKELNAEDAIISNDCLPIIEPSHSEKHKNNKTNSLHNDALTFLKNNFKNKDNIHFQWIPRKLNREAHWLSQKKELSEVIKLSKALEKQNSKLSKKKRKRKRNKNSTKKSSKVDLSHFNTPIDKKVILENDFKTPYIISDNVRLQYQLHCPKSYKKCKSNEEVDLKIIRSIELGKKKQIDESFFTSQYWNIIFEIQDNSVKSINNAPFGHTYRVQEKKKKQWYKSQSDSVETSSLQHA